jgi:hypothetical protein
VIAGIGFLVFEIRQNTIAVRSEAALGIQAQTQGIYQTLLTDPMMDIYVRGMVGPGDLDTVEAAKLSTFLCLLVSVYENLHVQVREGVYDDAMAQGSWQILRNVMDYPAMQDYWQRRRLLVSAEFREYVETDVMALAPGQGTAVLSGQE